MLPYELRKALKLRRVASQVYYPTPEDLAFIKSLKPEDIFDKAFLMRFPAVIRDRKHLSRICTHLQYRFRKEPSFESVLNIGFDRITIRLCSALGSLALLLDLATALGLEIRGAPPPPNQELVAQREQVADRISSTIL